MALLRALASLAEDPGSVTSMHGMANKTTVTTVSGDPQSFLDPEGCYTHL